MTTHSVDRRIAGTPPRRWGGLRLRRGNENPGRNTPTSVGRTKLSNAMSRPSAEHPHVGGEDLVTPGGHHATAGTPPRRWGGPRYARWASRDRRNTPTSVGRTTSRPSCTRLSPEHPHVGGEDHSDAPQVGVRVGTPPRRWGGRLPRLHGEALDRNTPTSVGRTISSMRETTALAEHPHVGGEDLEERPCVANPLGTPPRRWGGLLPDGVPAVARRNTPTSVGRTPGTPCARSTTPEHPHVGGEDVEPCRHDFLVPGTPPRRWGGRGCRRCAWSGLRNTPTSVGRTWSPSWVLDHRTEHPHVGGEDSIEENAKLPARGTPPRRWGGRTSRKCAW